MPVSFQPASAYTLDALTEIYNRGRSDYLVPMSMTPAQLAEYLRRYDIALDASCVALDEHGEPVGIGMLGLRDDRAWVTRLGVMPSLRGQHTGRHIMDWLIATARDRHVRLVQLEVILGNAPAHRLFTSCGFQPLRELVIVQRPPDQPTPTASPAEMTELDSNACAALLPALTVGASWVEEARSIVQSGGVWGFRLPDVGTLICHVGAARIEHIVMDTRDPDVVVKLLSALHARYPAHAATVENIPADSPLLPAYAQVGYTVAFRRVEMALAV